ncbi:MAG TPA: sensor histidine kinase [Pararhizobium sp.]|nr:sensor histidine kinase [Pararhizobium sp.]
MMDILRRPTRAIRPRHSIALRLAISLTVVLAVAAAATIFASYSYGRRAADGAFDRLLTGAALQITERISVVDGKPIVDIPLSAFELLSLARNDRIFYRIVGPSGRTLTGYPDFPLPAESLTQETLYNTVYDGVPVRAVMLQRQLAERSLSGNVDVIVAQTTLARDALSREIATPAAVGIGIASIAVLAVALIAMQFALRPLGRIEKAILGRDPLDLTPFKMTIPREVDALVSAINRFMWRLDRRMKGIQDFVADAAHQMRTPITALRAQTELAMGEQDPERLRMLQQKILSRAIGISRLTDQLLSRALITHRADAVSLENVDLRRVAMEADREIRSGGLPAAERLVLELPEEPVMVRGDLFSLREATKNLVNNAFVHGAAPVVLSVSRDVSGTCHLAVTDRGPGPALNLREIGLRFMRNEDRPESAGLGLAIVREVALLHDGRLTAEKSAEGFRIGIALAGTVTEKPV